MYQMIEMDIIFPKITHELSRLTCLDTTNLQSLEFFHPEIETAEKCTFSTTAENLFLALFL